MQVHSLIQKVSMESIYVSSTALNSANPAFIKAKPLLCRTHSLCFSMNETQGLAAPKVVSHGPESKVLRLFSYSEGKFLGVRIIILTISNERMYISVNDV